MFKFTRSEILFIIGMFFLGVIVMVLFSQVSVMQNETRKHWDFQAIDTMKHSRDLAREERTDPNYSKLVEKQIAWIAETGATHVAIGTPYDDEFLPVTKLWARTAREHGLKVWFRGNWSGWEEWFGYSAITQEEHTDRTRQFIINNPSLFENGDVFSSCPECENGVNVHLTNEFEVSEYRKFLINEYRVTKDAFRSIDKDVKSNYFSMNADVAKMVMDPETTDALDGIVVIDHYVKTPEQLAQDIVYISQLSGGKIVLGEIGAPIPDIHGKMTDEEQRKWILESMMLLASLDELEGLNYWVIQDGSTALVRPNDTKKPSYDVIKQYFGGNK